LHFVVIIIIVIVVAIVVAVVDFIETLLWQRASSNCKNMCR